MKIIEKIVKAQKAEERAEESLVMKRLYTAFLEGGLNIEKACEVLRSGGENGKKDNKVETMKTEINEKEEMKMTKQNEEIENREKRRDSRACGQGMC